MSDSAEFVTSKGEKEPTSHIYRDGRFAVLRQIPIEELPPVDGYEKAELEDEQANEAEGFMSYAVTASEFLENNTPGHRAYDHPYPEAADPLIGFEYNGVRFAVEVRHFRSQPEYVLVSMQRGDEVRFTLADVQDFLRSSQSVEYLREFAGYVESDNPLATLSRDPNAEATIRTSAELGYLVRLEARDAHLAASPNLHIAPSNTKMALYVAKLADRGGLAIDGKVTNESVIPEVQAFDPGTIEDELKVLAQSHPRLKRALLDSIEAISLDDVDFGSKWRRDESRETKALNQLIAAGKAEVALDSEDISGPAIELISKIDLHSGAGLNLFYENISRQYAHESDETQRELLMRTIEQALPQFRTRMVELLEQQHVRLPEDVSVEWLLSSEAEIDAMLSLAKTYAGELEYNEKDPALTADIVTIFRQIAENPDYTLTEEQRAILTAAGVNIDLLPLGLQEAAKGESNAPLFLRLGRLFVDGEIEERADEIARDNETDELLSQIAGFVDQPSRDLLKELIKKGDEYPLATGTTVEEFVAELPEIEAARQAVAERDGASLEPLTKLEIGKLLANKLKPGFEKLFASDKVESVTVDNDKGVIFVMKPGTAPAEWAGPQTDDVPVKHKIVPSEDARTIVLDYRNLVNMDEAAQVSFYKGVNTPASEINDDGSFIVTVQF